MDVAQECGGAEEAAAAGRGEKRERDREVRLGLRGGKGLDCGFILRIIRVFLENRERQMSAREGASNAPNALVLAEPSGF